ncbi:disulfide bond formation protein B [Undibacterium griseum]|uniref:Disulfide bond formation protein B n=1 Tax=Undibacterium griseum TaxID=2762295 RepID=A0ABR6YNU7_9BURK|nr:disulfide bond formation protein B [Undibacterium griseum]MBC3885570.1 disulfide bond formation protein B [Undibacterium griseum]
MPAFRPALLAVSVICLTLLGVALYLQIVELMLPCPLCVLQRYAFLCIGLFSLIAAFLPPPRRRYGIGLAALSALTGMGIAGKHLYVLSNPTLSCGIDPLETGLNKIFLSEWFPIIFRADGLCETPYPPILGLSIPAWAMIWFVIFSVVLGTLFFSRTRTSIFGERH